MTIYTLEIKQRTGNDHIYFGNEREDGYAFFHGSFAAMEINVHK